MPKFLITLCRHADTLSDNQKTFVSTVVWSKYDACPQRGIYINTLKTIIKGLYQGRVIGSK
jgi:hypothetical protein